MDNELMKRKDIRLKCYDYSSKGAYFVTICVKDRKRILSDIVRPVGEGTFDDPIRSTLQIHLTRLGKIVKKNLLSSEKISGVKIDRYIIMPDHIHAIIILDPEGCLQGEKHVEHATTRSNETLPHIISTFKRFCNREIGENIFQRGYYEHIIRDKEDYETKIRYIHENLIRWYYDNLKLEGE